MIDWPMPLVEGWITVTVGIASAAVHCFRRDSSAARLAMP